MKKGISPIVAVVLLIAVAIIAACGLYFWTAGIATKQPVPQQAAVINAIPLGGGKVLIANLGSTEITGGLQSTEGVLSCDYPIPPGEQVACNLTGTGEAGVVIYGASTGSAIVEPAVVGDCTNCANGMGCDGAGDCVSGYCNNSICAACGQHQECGNGLQCSGGVCASCAPNCADNVTCSSYSQCASGHCIDGSCTSTCESGGVILDCACTISTPGSYVLDRDLTYHSTDCIRLTMPASGSTLDCQGHTITGPWPEGGWTTGVASIGSSNLVVKNCVVKSFYLGLYFELPTDNHLIANNTATGCGSGIYLYYSNNDTITGNNASYNWNGINGMSMNGTFAGNIANNNTANNGDAGGISIRGGGNNFTNNTASYNRLYGIVVSTLDGNLIHGNTLNYNGDSGVGLNSNYNNVTRNILVSNLNGVMVSYHTHDNLVADNTLTNNGQYGIFLYYADNNTFTGNDVTGSWVGMELYGSNNNTYGGNNATGNGFGDFFCSGNSLSNIDGGSNECDTPQDCTPWLTCV